jgi:hypothetical protein
LFGYDMSIVDTPWCDFSARASELPSWWWESRKKHIGVK